MLHKQQACAVSKGDFVASDCLQATATVCSSPLLLMLLKEAAESNA